MDLEAFTSIREHFDDFAHPTAFRDPAFDPAGAGAVPDGMTTPFVGHLLNYAASLMEAGEADLTIGVLFGRSLAYTMHGQLDRVHYACDDFSYGPEVRARFFSWLWTSGAVGSVRFFEMEASRFLRHQPPLIGHPIGLYFYDADHSYGATLAALRQVEPHLARRALVVVDDTNSPEVRRAVGDWLATTPAASLLFDLPSAENCHPTWWNGIQALAYRR